MERRSTLQPARNERKTMSGERSGGWKKWFRRILRGALIALLALVIVRIAAGVWARHVFERRLALLREAGEPLSLAEMAPGPVPAGENAATIYAGAFASLDGMTREELEEAANLGSAGRELTPEELVRARVLLGRAKDAVTLLTAGASRSRCRDRKSVV